MSKIEIVSAKLVNGLFCHYVYREEIGKNRHDTHKTKSERPAHEHLINAFAALAIHLPVILQDIRPEEVEDINATVNGFTGTDAFKELLEKFAVTEVEREIEEGRARLIGTKVLDLGTLGVDTPLIRYEGEYHFKLEFQFGIDRLMREVELYREGKQAPEMVQVEIFGAAAEGGESGDEKPKAKRGRPKKEQKQEDSSQPRPGIGIYEDVTGQFPQYKGRDIYDPLDAREGDIIGIDANDDSPIIYHESEPISNFQMDPADVQD